jgi:hypothetical protein
MRFAKRNRQRSPLGEANKAKWFMLMTSEFFRLKPNQDLETRRVVAWAGIAL